MSSQQGKLPSTAELERFVKEKTPVLFFTADGKEHKGILRWFDETAFALTTSEKPEKHITLLKQAVIGYGPQEQAK